MRLNKKKLIIFLYKPKIIFLSILEMTKAKDYLILAFFTLILLTPESESLKCGKENIDNCKKCNEKENINRCEICEDKYFLTANKLFCIPCDDETQGQPGCEGPCVGVDYGEIRNIYCDKCKDGYVNMEKFCVKCEMQQEYCFKCKYEDEKGLDKFRCLECLEGYILYDDGHCYDCFYFLPGCKKCHFEGDKPVCDECYSNFYLTEDKKCLQNINTCENGYFLNDEFPCVPCPENCRHCHYDNEKAKVICTNFYCQNWELKNDIYSCTTCDYRQTLVEDIDTNIKYCYNRPNKLYHCTEGIMKVPFPKDDPQYRQNPAQFPPDQFIYNCTKCIENSHLNEKKECDCDYDCFDKGRINNDYGYKCYKCNDHMIGNPGCDAEKGCTFDAHNNQLNCNNCIEGFFEFTKGQCYSCSKEIQNCDKCHFEDEENKKGRLICDKCDDNYIVNSENNKCELADCQEYPEISPGCIICKDKLNEYLQNKKCQQCKFGYFKTRKEQCAYCNTEQNGGQACYECGYESEENDNIICKTCFPYYYDLYPDRNKYDYINNYYWRSDFSGLLSSYNKCYYCKIFFCSVCLRCEFRKNNDGTEKLMCTSCSIGFYLNKDGNCVSYASLIPKIKQCGKYRYFLEGTRYDIKFFNEEDDNYSIQISGSTNWINGLENIEPQCLECFDNYFFNESGECEELNYEKCSFNSLITQNREKLIINCRNYCSNINSVLIFIPIIKEGNIIQEININNTFHLNENFTELISKEINPNKYKACLNNEGKGDEYSPFNLRYCKEAYFYQDNNSYICRKCLNNYNLSYDNLCFEYSGKNSELTLVTLENGEKEYNQQIDDLEGCIEATGVRFYAKGTYNCTSCGIGYRPYYSEFFGRTICQNIYEDPITEKKISYDVFNTIIDRVQAINGICEKNYMFTPDGKFCYRCDDEKVGMPGCNGACTFSLKRNQTILCEGTCKKGYIESSEGVCSPCSYIKKKENLFVLFVKIIN